MSTIKPGSDSARIDVYKNHGVKIQLTGKFCEQNSSNGVTSSPVVTASLKPMKKKLCKKLLEPIAERLPSAERLPLGNSSQGDHLTFVCVTETQKY